MMDTELITAQHLSPWFHLTAALLSACLGAFHALEPWRGRSTIAPPLANSGRRSRSAVLLGLRVTALHTVSLFAIGVVVLLVSRYLIPEPLYPWLGVLSGLSIAGLGCYVLLRRLYGAAIDHTHGESNHNHWFTFNQSPKQRPEQRPETIQPKPVEPPTPPASLSHFPAIGMFGVLLHSPEAWTVLLSAFALHRIALGFILLLAFSLGLGFAAAIVYAQPPMMRLQINRSLTGRRLPVASSTFITLLGLLIAGEALLASHLDLHLLTKEKLGPVLFVAGLGLVLGMRHSTDADHVVAISTIVSKQRSIRNAAIIGSVWGLGHTVTIFIVGSLIILFGVQIPPRAGLSMEFSVAIMLIVLGLLNLTGVMQKITARFTPPIAPEPVAWLSPGTSRKNFFRGSIERFGLYQCIRPLVVGLVHGLAGSAAVALLVLTTIHNPIWATVYLLIFGAGTIIGMMCMTAAMAVPLTYAGERYTSLSRYFGIASGMVSLCFGTFLIYQLGYVGGLFTSHPQWTPR